MEQYVIKGGNSLVGEVEIGGAKNAALAILAAATMADEPVVIENMPDVRDTNVLLDAIKSIGAYVERIDRHTVKINGATINDLIVENEYIKKISSIKTTGYGIYATHHMFLYKDEKIIPVKFMWWIPAILPLVPRFW